MKYNYLAESSNNIKGTGVLTTQRIDNGWTEKVLEDIGELYVDKVPKFKLINGKAVLRTSEERVREPSVKSASEILYDKKDTRKRRYKSESDGLFFEWQLLEVNGATQSKIDTAKQAWIDKVNEIKTDIPL